MCAGCRVSALRKAVVNVERAVVVFWILGIYLKEGKRSADVLSEVEEEGKEDVKIDIGWKGYGYQLAFIYITISITSEAWY